MKTCDKVIRSNEQLLVEIQTAGETRAGASATIYRIDKEIIPCDVPCPIIDVSMFHHIPFCD